MRQRVRRVFLVAGVVLATANIWTGAPLLGLWVGSQVVGGSGLSMLAVAVVVVTMAAACFGLAFVVASLSTAYRRAIGASPTVRQHVPWLRSMRGERPHGQPGGEPTLDALDRVLATMVIVAILVFEVWFFFFSGSPLGGPNGR